MPRIILRKPSRRSQHLSTIVIHRRLLNLLGLFLLANLPTITYALDPTAIATTTNVDTAGATVYSFTVKYTDDGLLLGSFGDDNVRVTGPAGFDVRGRFVSESPNALGNQITVTYSITPPGGSWDAGDNGTYTIVMQPGQVNDQLGNPVAAGPIGAFTVAAPGPVASPTPSATPSLTRLANISTRLLVETGDNALIGGFIITGTQAKKV